MFYQLKRHPVPVRAFFRHSLVLTYALPQEVLRPLIPPGLTLDTLNDFGFLAIAMVQTESLRPICLPRALGRNFFLSGYRIFTRFKTSSGRTLRGLRILRSDTDSRMMVAFGNALTHYAYRYARITVSETPETLEIQITTPNAEADVHCLAHVGAPAERLPEGSPFADLHQARLFAGPLPFTFDCEAQTNSMVMIEGVREKWAPKPVRVEIFEATFFAREPFRKVQPILANAFHVKNIGYKWRRGVRQRLPQD
jgi:hypothetical protein